MSKMTLNKLAESMERGFAAIQVSLLTLQSQMVEGFAKVDKEFGKIDEKFNKLEAKVDNLESKVHGVEIKVDRALYIDYVNLEARTTKIEEHTGLKE